MGLSIGIIMDGNRRYAKERGMDPWEGHRKGADTLKACVEWSLERGGIDHLFFYTLSTENWKRDPKELEYLFALIEEIFSSFSKEAHEKGVRIRIVGERHRFSEHIQKIFAECEALTAHNTAMTAWFGLSYGGRTELVDAINVAVSEGKPVTEDSFKAFLWTADLPDPEIIIRTGGEQRLSNFLTWGSVYSEFFFPKTYWPAFTKEEYYTILDEYSDRDRRMGK